MFTDHQWPASWSVVNIKHNYTCEMYLHLVILCSYSRVRVHSPGSQFPTLSSSHFSRGIILVTFSSSLKTSENIVQVALRVKIIQGGRGFPFVPLIVMLGKRRRSNMNWVLGRVRMCVIVTDLNCDQVTTHSSSHNDSDNILCQPNIKKS